MRTHRSRHARPTGRPGRLPRLLSGLLAAALGAGLLVVLPTTAHAAGNSLYFSHNGSDHASFGANGVVMIDGTITFDDNCLGWGGTREGTDDFVYPATDVYIVEAGSATDGSGLTDAAGDGPNTIVGTGSGAFLGELIGVVTPTGMLPEGEFDIVYDTCQDGVVDAEDEIFYDAITVDVPDGQLPPVNDSIRLLKDRAREEYATWLIMHMGLQALFKLDDAKAIASCLLAPSPECLFEVLTIINDLDTARAKGEDWIEESTLKLIMNRAKNYGAIWKDPADPEFRQLPSVTAEAAQLPPSAGQPIADAIAGLTEPLAQEGALTEALLHALERYQGAQAAGDDEWALVQARAVRDLSTALDQHLGSTTAVADLRAAFAADIDDVEANAAEGAAVINRIRQQGFSPAERRQLANRGLTAAQIGATEDGFVRRGPAYAPEGSRILDDFDAALDAQAGMRDALAGSADGWNTLVEALEERVDEQHPEADAGGPYGTKNGGPVTLDASSSSAAPGAAKLTGVAWDLDGDGQFDDADGAVVDATVRSSRTIAVKVTDAAGRSAVDFARVTVEGGDRAPVIDSTSPANAVELRTGTSQAFSVVAHDPDGGAPTYRWTLGGEVVNGATGATFTYAPTASDVGARMLSVQVTRDGRSAAHSWVVTVIGPDADGDGWTSTPDCDDTRADRHPGAYERVGNGIDDDCDALTQDAPTGGITGSVMAWGHSVANGLPAPGPPEVRHSPTAVPSLGSSVRAVETGFRTGFALMADGGVKSWGQNFNGVLGNGNQTQQWTPVDVKNVDGRDGVLGAAVQVAADDDTALALRSGGSVVAWGSNVNQQLGDGSLVDERLTPVTVLDETGAALTGITQVEEGEQTSYAVTADGKVRNWGVVHCDANLATTTRRNLAAVNPLFGSNVVQVVSGDTGGALARRADGSVLSCSSYDPMLGRTGSGNDAMTPKPVTALGSGVVDIAMGMSSAAALKEDGTVWTWGRNLNHTLDVIGLGADVIQQLPKQVPLPAGPPVVDIEMDYSSTTFATRADGSVLVWGANVNGSGGTGVPDYGIAVPPKPIDLKGGRAIQVASSTWNGLALVRPADDPTFERPAQYVTASVADTSIEEGAGGTATLTLSEDAPDDLTVTYTVGNGPERTAPVAKGADAAQLPVTVQDDQRDEDDEELPLQVVSISHGVRVDGGSAVVTVLDDDAAPTVSVGSVKVAEGGTSLTDVPVKVSLSAVSGKDIEVLWTTADGTAVAPADYTEASGHVLVPAGTTSATVHVPVNGDTTPEPDEALAVRLSNPLNVLIAKAEGTVTITDDDPLRLAVDSPSVIEGGPGATPATFTVSVREMPAGESFTVPWSVKPGTAELGTDVVDADGSLTFDAAHLVRTVTVGVVGDSKVEPLATEVFSLELGTPTSSTGRTVIPADSAVATITDDDNGPSVSAGGDVTGTEGSAVEIVGQASSPATWAVDAPGCTVADPVALSTTVTCVDETTATLTLTADDGANPAVSDTAVLSVGNAAPTVTVTSPSGSTTVKTGQPVTVAATVTDPGSQDVLACSVAWGDGASSTGCSPTHAYSAAGSYDLVVTGSDGDGGQDSRTVTVKVVTPDPEPGPAWPWQGFFAPVDNPPVINTVKAGSAVPMIFSVGGYRGPDIFASGSPTSVVHACGTGPFDALESTASAKSPDLGYSASGRYQYTWRTERAWAGQCRTVTLTLADGSVHSAEFKLT